MKNFLRTSALILTLAVSGMAYANDGGKGGYGGHHFMDEAVAKLPEAKATAFKQAMEKVRKDNGAQKEQIHKIRDELHALLIAPKFDKDAYLAKGNELQAIENKMHDARQQAFADAVSGLTQDERTTLATAMKSKMHRMHKGGEKPAGDSK